MLIFYVNFRRFYSFSMLSSFFSSDLTMIAIGITMQQISIAGFIF